MRLSVAWAGHWGSVSIEVLVIEMADWLGASCGVVYRVDVRGDEDMSKSRNMSFGS